MHHKCPTKIQGKYINPFNMSVEFDYNIILKFLYVNAHGANIFKNPIGQEVFPTIPPHLTRILALTTKITYIWELMDLTTNSPYIHN